MKAFVLDDAYIDVFVKAAKTGIGAQHTDYHLIVKNYYKDIKDFASAKKIIDKAEKNLFKMMDAVNDDTPWGVTVAIKSSLNNYRMVLSEIKTILAYIY